MHPSWKSAINKELVQPYFIKLQNKVIEDRNTCNVYPPKGKIFTAFDLTPFDEIRVVILGQDPYHGAGQAHGLSFSVPDGIKPPPSLVNIFKELHDDLGVLIPKSGNLELWAKRGVFLLNSIMTVKESQPGSHKDYGWITFTDAVISCISSKKDPVVFILWGSFARSKKNLIDSRHLILEAPHPSPWSAHTGFIGSKPFSKTNAFLQSVGREPINWDLYG